MASSCSEFNFESSILYFDGKNVLKKLLGFKLDHFCFVFLIVLPFENELMRDIILCIKVHNQKTHFSKCNLAKALFYAEKISLYSQWL